jgi:GxxExxY protein
MTENDISYIIRGAIFEVYNEVGPGLLESVYQKALAFEIRQQGLEVLEEMPVEVHYKSERMDLGFRIDLLVEKKVLVELKSVEAIHKVHHKIVLTYLNLTDLKLGLLVNFNTDKIDKSIYRKVNGL